MNHIKLDGSFKWVGQSRIFCFFWTFLNTNQKSENLQIQNDLYEYPLVTYFSREFSLDNRTLFGRYYSKISQLRCITKQRGLLVSLYTRQLVLQRFNQIFKTLNDLHFVSIFINVKQINFVIDGLFKKAIIFFLPLFSLSLFLFSVKGPANAEKGSATNNDCRFGLILRQLRPWTIVFGLYILQTIIRGNST